MPIAERDTCGIDMDNTWCERGQREAQTIQSSYGKKDRLSSSSGYTDGMRNAESKRLERHSGVFSDGHQSRWLNTQQDGQTVRSGSCDMANANKFGASEERQQRSGEQLRVGENEGNSNDLNMADASFGANIGSKPQPDIGTVEEINGCGNAGFWDNAVWLNGADGKTRRAKPGVRLLAHGVPARVGKLRAYGNAIVPPLAAEVIKAFMETGESHENT
jgi:hypothetical protein